MSSKDLDYMRRLGEFEAGGAEERQCAYDKLSISERLANSMELYRRFRSSANLEARVDDPTLFYDRARRLGLYRP